MAIFQVQSVNGEKTLVPVSGSMSTGNPVGTLITTYKKIRPKNYLYCDGRDTTGTDDELSTHYPALYMYLGSNVLPDYRECVMVGAEQNTTDTIATHDVYTQGQFKDDQMQFHKHNVGANGDPNYPLGYGSEWSTSFSNGISKTSTTKGIIVRTSNIVQGRNGDITHGKQKAVYVYIKAVDGVDITDEDSFLSVVENYVDTKADAVLSKAGNWIYIPSPVNVTTYVKIGIEYNKGYITPLVIAQAYVQTYILSETSKAKSISGGQYGLNGISWTAYNVDTDKFFWLRIVGYWQIILFSTHKLSILQRTTTAPSGITFTSPT